MLFELNSSSYERAGPAIETPGVVDDKNKTLFMFGMLPNISPWI